jgi:hypothetical protein
VSIFSQTLCISPSDVVGRKLYHAAIGISSFAAAVLIAALSADAALELHDCTPEIASHNRSRSKSPDNKSPSTPEAPFVGLIP